MATPLHKIALGLGLLVLLSMGCTKQITVPLSGSVTQLTVSAFINSLHKTQYVVLSTSEPYLANVPNPAATGATVSIKDSKGNVFNFRPRTRKF